jgi:hypothetical protein
MGNSSSQPRKWFSVPFNNSTPEEPNTSNSYDMQNSSDMQYSSDVSQNAGTKRRKRTTKKNKTRGRINFSKIKWGSFTNIYNNFIKNNPHMKMHILDLSHFAHYVNSNPSQFNKKTHKKALFYTNVIERK